MGLSKILSADSFGTLGFTGRLTTDSSALGPVAALPVAAPVAPVAPVEPVRLLILMEQNLPWNPGLHSQTVGTLQYFPLFPQVHRPFLHSRLSQW
jgi:hypothetical protein